MSGGTRARKGREIGGRPIGKEKSGNARVRAMPPLNEWTRGERTLGHGSDAATTAWNREEFFARRESLRSRRTSWIFLGYLPGVNAGRWSPRAAPLYLVTITLGCMKCATGIQPSPHNSPIYDWAKLLSMRRIKSRARVQEKSAGRRDGRPRRAAAAARRGRVFPNPNARRDAPRIGKTRSRIVARGHALVPRVCTSDRHFPSIFLRAAATGSR